MKGFMCQSPSATAVCMASEPMSVIVPRRSDNKLGEGAKSMNNSKYIRLGEPAPRRSVSSSSSSTRKSSTTVPSLPLTLKIDQEEASQYLAPSSGAIEQVFQVVVLRVSIHCQGCAGKVKKHLSKMEGVTSFSIDLESKRVIVRGHVSPQGVLESLSKIKRAELWPCS